MSDPLKDQAAHVRAEAQRLYVDDPSTKLHPTYTQFNAFLDQVLSLCDTADPPQEDGQ
jgi:hypothetical protein